MTPQQESIEYREKVDFRGKPAEPRPLSPLMVLPNPPIKSAMKKPGQVSMTEPTMPESPLALSDDQPIKSVLKKPGQPKMKRIISIGECVFLLL